MFTHCYISFTFTWYLTYVCMKAKLHKFEIKVNSVHFTHYCDQIKVRSLVLSRYYKYAVQTCAMCMYCQSSFRCCNRHDDCHKKTRDTNGLLPWDCKIRSITQIKIGSPNTSRNTVYCLNSHFAINTCESTVIQTRLLCYEY